MLSWFLESDSPIVLDVGLLALLDRVTWWDLVWMGGSLAVEIVVVSCAVLGPFRAD